jgi:hypothetical protein
MKQINDHRTLHEWYEKKAASGHPLREPTSYEQKQRAQSRQHKVSAKNTASYERKARSKYAGEEKS